MARCKNAPKKSWKWILDSKSQYSAVTCEILQVIAKYCETLEIKVRAAANNIKYKIHVRYLRHILSTPRNGSSVLVVLVAPGDACHAATAQSLQLVELLEASTVAVDASRGMAARRDRIQ